MKNRVLFVVAAGIAVGSGLMGACQSSPSQRDLASTASPPAVAHSGSADSHTPRVPAYQSASQTNELPPTLAPTEFFGKAREAYQVAKEIPRTLAQLPCYCECDKTYGHKSLQTCFVDDHASHCAVCVDEALLAHKLEKEDKLSPEQVREKIIEAYSSSHPGTN
jgi:hypothetical protein